MALSTPMSLPTTRNMAKITFRARSIVGLGESPFTFEQQLQAMQGARWEADVVLPPMKRAYAEDWVGFLVATNGRENTFYLGDPANTSPRGTWAGAPKVNGAHAARVSSIVMKAFSAAATVAAGDWFQQGSGSSRHLHKIVQAGVADGSGALTIEVWPPTRVALADNDTFVTASAKGVFRLASNVREWSIEQARIYGLSFSCVEAL